MHTWFDTHAHLYQDEDDLNTIMTQARAAGVTQLLLAGTELADSREYVRLADSVPGVSAAIGIHPSDAESFTGDLAPFRELARCSGCVALGEIGLDYYRNSCPREQQRLVFTRFLELAIEVKRPVIIHSRDAMDDAYDMLRDAAAEGVRMLLHSFTGTPTDVERFAAIGAHFSVSGMVTFPKGDNIRAAVAVMPADRIVVETDSPWLTPVPYRGQRNQPAYVIEVGRAIAALRGWTLEETADLTTATAKRFFGL